MTGNRRARLVPRLALGSILSWLALATATAQTAPGTVGDEAFGDRVDVRAVDVDAVVTDRAGQRVDGLTAADFRLFVDGQEVAVDSFSAVENGRQVAGGSAEPSAGTPVGRSFLVFIDDSFTVGAQRDRVLAGLAAQLARLGADDQMAIVSFARGRLTTLADWTGDRAALGAALDRAKTQWSDGIRTVAARRSDSEDLQLRLEYDPIYQAQRVFGHLGRLSDETPELRNAAEVRALVRGMPRVIAATDAALRSLPAPPGRRVLLLLSGGWPIGSVPGLLWPLTATANRMGYTFYPVSVPGLDSQVFTVADARFAAPAHDSGFISTPWERDGEYALELLARATGGKAYLHSARLTAFERAEDDTRSYYRLGFSPTWKADDRQHEIRVEVRRLGVDVRARKSYVDLSTTAEGALEEQRQALSGVAAVGNDGTHGRSLR